MDDRVSFAMCGLDFEAAKKIIILSMKGEFPLEFQNRSNGIFHILTPTQLHEIYIASSEGIILDLDTGHCHPSTFRPIVPGNYHQISYQRLWIYTRQFESVLEKHPDILSQQNKNLASPQNQNRSNKKEYKEADLDKRKIKSFHKIIATLAYDSYKYDPTSAKSTIPKEISDDIMSTIGQALDPETVKNILTEATRAYPKAITKPD